MDFEKPELLETGADLDAFLKDLTELARKHGLGVSGGVVFVHDNSGREYEQDHWTEYVCDDDSNLLRKQVIPPHLKLVPGRDDPIFKAAECAILN